MIEKKKYTHCDKYLIVVVRIAVFTPQSRIHYKYHYAKCIGYEILEINFKPLLLQQLVLSPSLKCYFLLDPNG